MRKSGRARILGSILASCLLLGGALVGAEAASAAPANTVVATVNVGANAQGVAVTPDGRYAYVIAGTNSVSVIDTASNTVTTTIGGFTLPVGIAITPNGQFAYVTNYGGFGLGNSVSKVRISDNTIVSTISLGVGALGPSAIVVSPDGARVYIAESSADALAVIQTSNDAVTTVNGFSLPRGVAVTPDGQFVYVTNANANNVSVVRTSNNALVSTITVGTNPFGVTVTPNGQFAYVANLLGNSVSVIRTSDNTVVSTISAAPDPKAIVATPDGLSVLVVQQSGSAVSVISTATNSITSAIAVGGSPTSIAVSLSGQYAYVPSTDTFSVYVINLLAEAPGPTAPMQAFGRVAGGGCASGAPSWVDWPGIASMREVGWGASWAMWPNGGTGGYVCVRQPIYTTAGTWSTL